MLLDEVSPYFVTPVAYALAGIARVLPELVAAYRTGAGVPFSAYGDEIRDHIEQLNRPMFVNDLASSWLPAVPDLHARLQADPSARVADIACGSGWVSIALAQGYPKVRVNGFDLDETSIRRAARNAVETGVDDRVSFTVRNVGDPLRAGRYEAALMSEALHDLARPVEAFGRVARNAGRWRLHDRRRRTGRREVHRTGRRGGAADVRVQHPAFACRQVAPRPRPRPPALCCGPPPFGGTRARPDSATSRCCPWTTRCGASTA